MKLLPILLVNVATVGAGIAIYDQVVRPAAPGAAQEVLVGTHGATDVLSARLDALEQRGPSLSATPRPGLDRQQVLELLRTELARGGSPAPAPSSGGTADPEVIPGLPEGLTLDDLPEDLAGAYADPNITQFRAMYEKVQAMERAEREAEREREQTARMNQRLDELQIGLTSDQKGEVLAAAKAMRDERRDLFAKMRSGEVDREAMRAAMEKQRNDLVTAIERVVPNSDDAQKVAAIVGGGRGMAFGAADDGGGFSAGGARPRRR